MTAFGRNPAERRERGPLYQFTVFQLFGASFASIALGIARTTLDAFIELAKEEVAGRRKYLLRDNAVIQSQIGLAQSQLDVGAGVPACTPSPISGRARRPATSRSSSACNLRMASSHASHQAKQVVDAAYHAAGATAIFEIQPVRAPLPRRATRCRNRCRRIFRCSRRSASTTWGCRCIRG